MVQSRLAATLEALASKALGEGLRTDGTGAGSAGGGGAAERDGRPGGGRLGRSPPAGALAARPGAGRCWSSWPLTGPSPFAGSAHREQAGRGDIDAIRGMADAWLSWAERLMSLRAALEQAGAAEAEDAGRACAVWPNRRWTS